MRAGDTLEVREYERLLPLKAEKAALGTLQGVRKGDCLVAFSRREVHAIKRALEAWGAFRSCVVYGALPAESRTQQVTAIIPGYRCLAWGGPPVGDTFSAPCSARLPTRRKAPQVLRCLKSCCLAET